MASAGASYALGRGFESRLRNMTHRSKLWPILLLLVCLSGCASFPRDPAEITLADAWPTACAIEYKSEPPADDHWQAPEETLLLGTGDCEDKAILLWYVIRHVHAATDARVVVGQINILFDRGAHAWVEVGTGVTTLIMDPTSEQVYFRYMLNGLTYVPIAPDIFKPKAMAFMKATGYRNLNPDAGWK